MPTEQETMQQPSQQLVDLQMSIAHLEITVDELNAVIANQDKEIQDMKRQIQLMYKHIDANTDDGIAPFDLMADRPPHY